ncbi:MAG: O-antigen ligase family protein [Anaerolineae bacterium]
MTRSSKRLHLDLWRVLVLSIPLFFLPFTLYTFEPDKAALLRAVIILLAATFLLSRGPLPPVDAPTLLAVSLWVWTGLAVAASMEPARSLWGEPRWGQGWITLTAFVLLFLMARRALATTARQRAVLDAIIAASVPVSLYAVAQAIGLDPFGFSAPWERAQSTFSHANALGGYLVMVMPLAWARWREADQKLPWAAVIGIQALALLLTLSRSAWIAGAAAAWLFAMIYARSKVARITLAGAGLAGVATITVLTLLPTAPPTAPEWWQSLSGLVRLSSPTVQVRLNVWMATLRAIAEAPLFGWGPETLNLALPPYFPAELALIGNLMAVAGRAHNDLLVWALFAGLPAAVLYAALLATGIQAGIQRSTHLPLLIGLGAGVFNHLLDVSTITSSMLVWLYLGILTAAPAKVHARARPGPIARTAVLVGAGGLIMLVSVRPVVADTFGRSALALHTIGATEAAAEAVAWAARLDVRPTAYTWLQADIHGEDARSDLEAALIRTPTDLDLVDRMVEIERVRALQTGEWTAAYAQCDILIEASPANPDVHMRCGDLRLWARDPEGARRFYEEAAALAPAYYQPYANLATVHRWLEDPVLADHYAERAEAARRACEQAINQR